MVTFFVLFLSAIPVSVSKAVKMVLIMVLVLYSPTPLNQVFIVMTVLCKLAHCISYDCVVPLLGKDNVIIHIDVLVQTILFVVIC